MEAKDRITRCKIQIQKNNPFFAYLSLYLKEEEDTKGILKELGGGMGVDVNGGLLYDVDFVNGLNDEELQGVIIHEILHLAFLHLLRSGERNPRVSNLCDDIVVNQLIKDNGFTLPKKGLIPDSDNKIIIFGQLIEDCNKKITEEIYDELDIKEVKVMVGGAGKSKGGKGKNAIGDSKGEEGRFDIHFKGDGLSAKEKKKLKKIWDGRLHEACSVAKMKGNVPVGIERLIGKLHEQKIPWREVLYNYITSQIPYDYTWGRCNKKSVSVGTYLPSTLKEKIDIVICIDVSVSIGQKELNDFLSEIIGIAKTFQERITMRLLTHETKINNDYTIDNGNIEKIKGLKIEGGGGTSHIQPFKFIADNIMDCKCCIFLTDGYSDLDEIKFEQYPFDKLFVISKGGDEGCLKDKNCKVIKLGKMENEKV